MRDAELVVSLLTGMMLAILRLVKILPVRWLNDLYCWSVLISPRVLEQKAAHVCSLSHFKITAQYHRKDVKKKKGKQNSLNKKLGCFTFSMLGRVASGPQGPRDLQSGGGVDPSCGDGRKDTIGTIECLFLALQSLSVQTSDITSTTRKNGALGWERGADSQRGCGDRRAGRMGPRRARRDGHSIRMSTQTNSLRPDSNSEHFCGRAALHNLAERALAVGRREAGAED